MTTFKLVKIKINLRIEPKYINNPQKSINNKLQKYLLKHSYKLGGTLLSFKLKRITNKCIITGRDPCPTTSCIVDCLVLSLNVGDIIFCTDGCYLGIFNVSLSNSSDKKAEVVNGHVVVKELLRSENGLIEICADNIDS